MFFSRVPYLLSTLLGAVAVRDSCEGHARGHVFKHLSYYRNDSLFTWLNLHHFYFSFTYSGFVNRTLKEIPRLKFDSCCYISKVTKLSLIISYIKDNHSVHQVVFLIGSQKFQWIQFKLQFYCDQYLKTHQHQGDFICGYRTVEAP